MLIPLVSFASQITMASTKAPPTQNQIKILAPVALSNAMGAAYTSINAHSQKSALPAEMTCPRSKDATVRVKCTDMEHHS